MTSSPSDSTQQPDTKVYDLLAVRAQDKEQDPKLVLYSNRPPTGELAGGAVRVIAAANPDVWLGPEGHIEYAEWKDMPASSRRELQHYEVENKDSTIDVYTFKAPENWEHSQYNIIANALLWPIAHSMDPEVFKNPMAAAERENAEEYVFTFPQADIEAADCTTVEEYVAKSFNEYLQFNSNANVAFNGLKRDEIINDKDTVWVHDYQCVSVKGDIFSRHIPFPPMEYLEKVKIGETPLLEMDFFKQYLRHISTHALVTFQRPVDMENFVAALDKVDPAFHANNPGLFDKEGNIIIPDVIGSESQTPLKAFGRNTTILNIPVGISQEENLAEAIENETNLSKSRIKPEALTRTGIEVTEAMLGKDGKISLKDAIGEDILTGEDHRIFASFHRNDYTKSTMEKLQAIDAFLEQNPDEVGKSHFMMGLQPTRGDVAGYGEYQDAVLNYSAELREKYGDSIIIIPASIDHGDIMGLLRNQNMVGFIGAGKKDGHDLTVREAVDAKADREDDFVAIITTDGVGASDIYKGSEETPGAYVLKTDCSQPEFIQQMTDAIADVVSKSRSIEGKQELRQRFEYLRDQSEIYSGANFRDVILGSYEQIQQYRNRSNQQNVAMAR